jgi:hypothetical protein
MDTDADIDAAAEDPPALWVTVAAGGLVVIVGGILAFAIDLLGLSGSIVDRLPALAPIFRLSPLLPVLGLGLFAFAMWQWSPDVEV